MWCTDPELAYPLSGRIFYNRTTAQEPVTCSCRSYCSGTQVQCPSSNRRVTCFVCVGASRWKLWCRDCDRYSDFTHKVDVSHSWHILEGGVGHTAAGNAEEVVIHLPFRIDPLSLI